MDFKRHTCKVIITLIIATCLVSGCEKIPTSGIPVVQATLDTPPIGVGEVGNISVGEDGTGVLEFMTPFWSLGGDPNTDILGKLIMIHETGDTFLTNPHAHRPNMQTDMNMETVQPHFHPPGTPHTPRQHADDDTYHPTGRRCQNRLRFDRTGGIISSVGVTSWSRFL